MTTTRTVKHYGDTVVTTGRTVAEQVVEHTRTPLLAVVGVGDLAVQRARTVADTLRARAEALPGETQVQADLAAKEARTRATEAAHTARTRAQQVAGQLGTATRTDSVLGAVSGLVDTARHQVTTLAERGAVVVDELRRQPGLRRVTRRAQDSVDTVEAGVEKSLEETAEAVATASDEVTSVAQKTAAKTTKGTREAQARTQEAAESAKATSARVTRARTAERTDPTAVPAKKD